MAESTSNFQLSLKDVFRGKKDFEYLVYIYAYKPERVSGIIIDF